jgi:hypothetical protein
VESILIAADVALSIAENSEYKRGLYAYTISASFVDCRMNGKEPSLSLGDNGVRRLV